MKFEINAKDLIPVLKKAILATEKKSALPILSTFKLEAKDNKITIFATNLEVSQEISTIAKIKEEGVVCVNAFRLFEIVKNLKDIIKFKTTDKYLNISSGSLKYKLSIVNPEDFPKFQRPEKKNFEIFADDLKDIIRKTIYAVSKEESRYALEGVLINGKEDKVDFVATDGHRLSLVRVKKEVENEINAVVNIDLLKTLKKVMVGIEDIEIYSDQAYTSFKSLEWYVEGRNISGIFPSYEKILPTTFNTKIKINKEDLLNALQRVSVIYEDKVKPVKLILKDNKLTLRSFSQEYGEAVDEMDIDYQADEFIIGFNANYIIETLSTIDEKEVNIFFTDKEGPIKIVPIKEEDSKDFEYISIVMPMNID